MAAIRMVKRVGKKATKFQFTATYQSILLECQNSTWVPHSIAIAWSRRGRRFITTVRTWEPSPDNQLRAALVWPEEETMETVITLYKGPKDKNYETKEWEFAVLDIDEAGKRKVLATHSINMVKYASSLPIEHELHLMMKPVSRKIKKAILEVSLCSVFLKEGKATDDDMISLASNLSVSNLSTIGFLEDDDEGSVRDDDRPASPVDPSSVLSIDALLKWAQEITQGYHGVSIVNMTTSWRNGLAFLAIIHYYKPQLFDYDQLAPTSIKENNKLAFELARSLGISCPLTVNMMLTNTVPDKLAITSFVYQMNSYFTKATLSAIARDGNALQSGSPNLSSFDLASFQQFTYNNIPTSPTSLAGAQNHEKHNLYSRHSKSSLNEGSAITEVPQSEPSIEAGGIAGNSDVKQTEGTQSQTKTLDDGGNVQMNSKSITSNGVAVYSKPTSFKNSPDTAMHAKSSTPLPLLEGNTNPRTEALSLESGAGGDSMPNPSLSSHVDSADRNVVYSKSITSSSLEGTNSGRTHSKPSTSSSSLLGSSNGSAMHLKPSASSPSLLEGNNEGQLHSEPTTSSILECKNTQVNSKLSTSSSLVEDGSKSGQIQPSPCADTATDISEPGTCIANADKLEQSPPTGGSIETKPVVPPTNDEAKRLLRKKEVQKLLKQVRNRDGLFNTSKSSCDSDSSENQYVRAARNLIATTLDTSSDSTKEIEVRTLNNAKDKSEPPSDIEDQSLSFYTNTSLNYQSPSTHSTEKTSGMNTNPLSHRSPELSGTSALKSGGLSSSALSPSDNSISGISSNTEQDESILISPPDVQPYFTKRESQGEETATKRLEVQQMEAKINDTEGLRVKKEAERQKAKEEEEAEQLEAAREKADDGNNGASAEDWNQHSEALSQDMLLSQSEYVKGELTKLKIQLQKLEVRASSIEVDIRDAMSQGDKRREELLMQEWFGILNRKNKLIKHQISLNILDKEEDLDRRQFFLRRELRSLMSVQDSQKTQEQKVREAQLLQQLVDLVDEQDRLERKKMATQGRGPDDAEPVAPLQSNPKQGSKECTVS